MSLVFIDETLIK
jgi:hypothetical protein